MALYRIGTAAMDAQGVITGTGTKWREPLSLIRTGATIVFLEQPVIQLAVISEIVSDTEMKAISTDGAVVPDGKYVILLNDSLTVDGMAQDVAETLRYYQSKETVIEEALDFFNNFDLKELQDLINKVHADASQVAADKVETEQLKNDTQQIKDSAVNETQQIKDAAVNETQQIKDAAVAETNQIKADTDAIKNQTQQIKDSAVTEITGIKNEALDARDEAENAQLAAEQSKVGADNAKSGAETARDEARQWAQQVNPDNMLHKDQNLADLPDKAASRKNLALDRVSQFTSETLLRAPATATYFTVGGASWGVYDSINATWKPLAVAQGGTGAKNDADARKNLKVDSLSQQENQTWLYSPNNSYKLVIDNSGGWGLYNEALSEFTPLGIGVGGTGAKTAAGARANLDASTCIALSSTTNWYADFQSRRDFGRAAWGDNAPVGRWDAPGNFTNAIYFPTNASNMGLAISASWGSNYDYWMNSRRADKVGYDQWKGWSKLWHSNNTTVDGNGFIKSASPIIKVKGDGSFEANIQAEGAFVERIDIGVYKISGVLGFNSDPSWGGVGGGYSIPQNGNGLPLLWVDYDVSATGDITLRTYHREHVNVPKFAMNRIDGIADGDPIDIPVGRWVDIRVQMPYSDDEFDTKNINTNIA